MLYETVHWMLTSTTIHAHIWHYPTQLWTVAWMCWQSSWQVRFRPGSLPPMLLWGTLSHDQCRLRWVTVSDVLTLMLKLGVAARCALLAPLDSILQILRGYRMGMQIHGDPMMKYALTWIAIEKLNNYVFFLYEIYLHFYHIGSSWADRQYCGQGSASLVSRVLQSVSGPSVWENLCWDDETSWWKFQKSNSWL